jgi:RNA polymerase-binding transcription factor DksA
MATPAKKAAATKAAPAKKATAAASTKAEHAPTKAAAKKAAPAPTKATGTAKDIATAAAPAKATSTKTAPAPAKAAAKKGVPERPKPQGGRLDEKFLDQQRKLLKEERAKLLGQAESLEGEAAQLMEDLDPGDVQFDDESGEGDSLVVERERDLALSQQARQTISDIDAALARVEDGTYGYSLLSGRAIPRERLRAIPWATELVEEKVGGLGRR